MRQSQRKVREEVKQTESGGSCSVNDSLHMTTTATTNCKRGKDDLYVSHYNHFWTPEVLVMMIKRK